MLEVCGSDTALCVLLCCRQLVVGAVMNSGSDTISIGAKKRSNAVHNCWVGAAIYGGFVGVSLLCIFLPAVVCPPKKEEEQDLIAQYRSHRSE